MPNEARFFITVDWCNKGCRGIFCRNDGKTWGKDDQPHTQEEIDKSLGVFWIILKPKSELMTIEQVKERSYFVPLAEYSNEWGIAMTEETYERGIS